MKYVIISLVIAAIIAITAYILDFTNNKSDKIFLIIVVSLLILCGLFFSIKGEIFKDNESKVQSESLANTKQNTEELKEKSELIISNINENLERLTVINDSVSNLNTALTSVEKDLARQLEVFNKTLTQTKVFEQKVSEQLKLEKKRFELERPEVEVVATLEKKQGKEGNHYGILFQFRNLGKRVAKDFNSEAIIGIAKDKKNLAEHFKMESSLENFDITPMQAGGIEIKVRSSQSINLTGIENDLSLIVLLKYTYSDEFLGKIIEKEYYYFWYGFNKSGMLLLSDNNDDLRNRLDQYIKDNGLKL
ncbi:hypothetical protein [Confluentibacter sediminis]|uniref:hypothetical protein n=1 Tax=Confluentibacter sediminis TaxID=2219045 RepID=UPI000DAEC732|nr:hypothetical protein [Confluentibacter sediminis]